MTMKSLYKDTNVAHPSLAWFLHSQNKQDIVALQLTNPFLAPKKESNAANLADLTKMLPNSAQVYITVLIGNKVA